MCLGTWRPKSEVIGAWELMGEVLEDFSKENMASLVVDKCWVVD